MSDDHSSRRPESESVDSLFRELAEAPPRSVERAGETSEERASSERPRSVLPKGVRVQSRFEIIGPVGRGGFGAVYRARDLELGRHVAIKLLAPWGNSDPTSDRFRLFDKEAKATALLNHPNIVTMFDWGIWQNSPYLILELLGGETLWARIRRSPLSPTEAFPVAVQVLRALAHAHRTGLLHLDLKPQNIVCGEDGLVKILDLGLARITSDRDGISSALRGVPDELRKALEVSITGGTPAYMAPEQWRGAPLDARTDVWAVGVTLFQMLSGELPFEPSAALLEVPSERPSPSLRDRVGEIPQGWVRIVSKAMAKRPEDRFQTVQEMLDRLLALDPAGSRPQSHDVPPYRYLEAFTEGDAAWFFGRDREVSRLRAMLRNRALVAVVGPSGAGKSSLVEAGLTPRLRDEDDPWEILSLRPGAAPLTRLRRRLEELGTPIEGSLLDNASIAGQVLRSYAEASGRRILLFVDQFEELYNQVDSADERRAFATQLLLAGDDPQGRVRIVIALRADFLARLSEVPELRDLVSSNIMILGPPDAEAMTEALRGPARRLGFELEDTLSVELVDAIRTESTPLPLLQLAASRVWELRDPERRIVPHEALERIGGVAGVVAAHADEVLQQIADPDERRIAEAMFLRLVAPDRTRRPVLREELLGAFSDPGAAARVLEHLLAGRLLVTARDDAQGFVELVHESLIEGWSRLTRWLDEAQESLRHRERLTAAAEQWVEESRSPAFLWDGRRLREELERQRRGALRTSLSVNEAAFLSASADRHRTLRRRRASVAILAVLVVAAGVVLSLRATQRANLKDREAARATRTAKANAIVNAAATAEDPLVAALLLRELAGLPEPTAASDLAHTLARAALPTSSFTGYTPVTMGANNERFSVALSPDGSRIAFASGVDVQVRRTDGTGSTVRLRGSRELIFGVAFSNDGTQLAAGDIKGKVRLWHLSRPDRPLILGSGPPPASRVEFGPGLLVSEHGMKTLRLWPLSSRAPRPRTVGSGKGWIAEWHLAADGKAVLVARMDGVLERYVLESPGRPLVVRRLGVKINASTTSRDGRWFALAAQDGTVRVWRSDLSLEARVFSRHREPTSAVSFSKDGRRLASGSTDGDVRIWSLGTRDDTIRLETVALSGHSQAVWSLSFSPDGRRLLAGGESQQVSVWDLEGAGGPLALKGHRGDMAAAFFTVDGSRIATASRDRTIRLWPASGPAEPRVLIGHRKALNSVGFDPKGTRVVTASTDGTARVWHADGGGAPVILRGHSGPVGSATFTKDGAGVLTASVDGTARIWRADGSGTPVVLRSPGANLFYARMSPDGSRVIAGTRGGEPRLWWTAGSRPPEILRGHRENMVFGVAFSPDGARVATASDDRTVRIWTVGGAKPPLVLQGHTDGVKGVEFSPDGRLLATRSNDRTVRVWRADGTGKPFVFGGHAQSVTHVAFSPNGARVLSTDMDGVIRLWPANGHGRPIELRGHRGFVPPFGASFSRDGKWIVSCGLDRTARVWPASGAGKPIVLLHPKAVRSCAFGPEGTRIATASGRAAYIWRLWLHDWKGQLEFLRGATNACLSVEQRRKYLRETPAEARNARARCEAGFGRHPEPPTPPSPSKG